MTQQERKAMIPKETMVYKKIDGAGYTFMGIDKEGNYLLCGMPFGYEDYLIEDSFELRR